MNKINTAILVAILIFASGCKPNHRVVNENFNVSNIGATNENMTCKIRLDGTEKRAGIDDDTGMILSYVQSPYSLLIEFLFPKEQTGVVELQEISFSANGSVILKIPVNQKKEFDNLIEFRRGGKLICEEEDESSAAFILRDVDLPRCELKVSVKAVIWRNDEMIPKTWQFNLTPFTKEELRNTLMDTLMSV